MAEVAAIFVSPLLQVLFEKLTSGEFADFFRQRKLPESLVWQLKTEFLAFGAVVEDAEDLEDIKPVVRKWLDELRDVVHDAEDVLDEIATEALRSQQEPEIQTLTSKGFLCVSFFKHADCVGENIMKEHSTFWNFWSSHWKRRESGQGPSTVRPRKRKGLFGLKQSTG